MKSALIAAAFLLAAPAWADNCNAAMDQQTMNRCADQTYRAADARLNAAYGRLMAALADSAFQNKLRIAQRSWIQFRDSECIFETAENEGGSIHPMVYAGCLTRLTSIRTRDLEQQTACWKNAEKCGM